MRDLVKKRRKKEKEHSSRITDNKRDLYRGVLPGFGRPSVGQHQHSPQTWGHRGVGGHRGHAGPAFPVANIGQAGFDPGYFVPEQQQQGFGYGQNVPSMPQNPVQSQPNSVWIVNNPGYDLNNQSDTLDQLATDFANPEPGGYPIWQPGLNRPSNQGWQPDLNWPSNQGWQQGLNWPSNQGWQPDPVWQSNPYWQPSPNWQPGPSMSPAQNGFRGRGRRGRGCGKRRGRGRGG